MNSIVSAEVTFKNGEQKIREWTSQTANGNIIQYLPFHITMLYGCNGFAPNMQKFIIEALDPQHPLYINPLKPIGFDIFPNKKKNYNALAIKYEWPAGKIVNAELASDPTIFPKGIDSGFNGKNFTVHVTIAYIDGNIQLDKALIATKIEEIGLSFFDLTIKGVTLEISAKPE